MASVLQTAIIQAQTAPMAVALGAIVGAAAGYLKGKKVGKKRGGMGMGLN